MGNGQNGCMGDTSAHSAFGFVEVTPGGCPDNNKIIDPNVLINYGGEPVPYRYRDPGVFLLGDMTGQMRYYYPAALDGPGLPGNGLGVLISKGIHAHTCGGEETTALDEMSKTANPPLTSGNEPAAMELLAGGILLILNTKPGSASWQNHAHATIDRFMSESPDGGAQDPGYQLLDAIDLGVAEVLPFARLPMTADKHYAVVAGGDAGR
jgi:hypothetical protein